MDIYFYQFWRLFSQYLKIEFANLERLISALLFSCTLLIMFVFAQEVTEPSAVQGYYISQSLLTAMFALQISFARALEPDTQDGVFDQIRSMSISRGAWFWAKYGVVIITGGMILIPTLAIAAFFQADARVELLTVDMLIIDLIALLGLGAVGVLLSTMMLGSGTRQILYPILYFPLTTPVLISAVEANKMSLIDGATLGTLMNSWLGLLIIFDIIYITAGFLLFGELVGSD